MKMKQMITNTEFRQLISPPRLRSTSGPVPGWSVSVSLRCSWCWSLPSISARTPPSPFSARPSSIPRTDFSWLQLGAPPSLPAPPRPAPAPPPISTPAPASSPRAPWPGPPLGSSAFVAALARHSAYFQGDEYKMPPFIHATCWEIALLLQLCCLLSVRPLA